MLLFCLFKIKDSQTFVGSVHVQPETEIPRERGNSRNEAQEKAGGCGSLKEAPKVVPALIPITCEYVPSRGKGTWQV